jgi:hypothetical protein
MKELERFRINDAYLTEHGWVGADHGVGVFNQYRRYENPRFPAYYVTMNMNAAGTMEPPRCGWMLCTKAWSEIVSLGGDVEELKRALATRQLTT